MTAAMMLVARTPYALWSYAARHAALNCARRRLGRPDNKTAWERENPDKQMTDVLYPFGCAATYDKDFDKLEKNRKGRASSPYADRNRPPEELGLKAWDGSGGGRYGM